MNFSVRKVFPGVTGTVKIQSGELLHQGHDGIGDFLQIALYIDPGVNVVDKGAGIDGNGFIGNIIPGRKYMRFLFVTGTLLRADSVGTVFVDTQTAVGAGGGTGVMTRALFGTNGFFTAFVGTKTTVGTNLGAAVMALALLGADGIGTLCIGTQTAVGTGVGAGMMALTLICAGRLLTAGV